MHYAEAVEFKQGLKGGRQSTEEREEANPFQTEGITCAKERARWADLGAKAMWPRRGKQDSQDRWGAVAPQPPWTLRT